MNPNKTDKLIKEYKTACCNSKWSEKRKLNYRCDKCGKEITMEILLLYDAIEN